MADSQDQSPEKRRFKKIQRSRDPKPCANRQSTNNNKNTKTSQSRPESEDSSPVNSRSLEKKRRLKSRNELKIPTRKAQSAKKESGESTKSEDLRKGKEKKKTIRASEQRFPGMKNRKTEEHVDKNKNKQIKPGTLIKAKKRVYEVVKVIGAGGFGEVYEVHDENNKLYAMKTEHLNVNSKIKSRMKLEIHAYEKIKEEKKANPDNVQHLLYMYDNGVTDTHRYFTMTYTGPSLESLIKKHEICMKSAIRLAIQTFDGITELHKLGIMHRDIKPANFVVGREKKAMSTVFLVDHGMSSLFATELDKVPARSQYRFLGTLSYAPRASHHGKAQCRRDDLESWLYMALEFFVPDVLPWAKEGNEKRVLEMKQKMFKDPQRYLKDMPTCFQYFPDIIDVIGIVEEPKYETFKEVMMTLASMEKVDFDEPFEWEPKSRVEKKTNTTTTTTKSNPSDDKEKGGSGEKNENEKEDAYCVIGNLMK